MPNEDPDPGVCRGAGCTARDDVMPRQIGSKEIRLCPECADRRRALTGQDRAGEPPRVVR